MSLVTEAATDTTVTSDSLHCPMCEYDLRGQVEPRCPECGYRFNWDELRDPARRLHPYLFEHHLRRNIWSFRRTLTAGLRPRRFWSTLFPTQPSRPRRLMLYFLIVSLTPILPLALEMARRVASARADIETFRAETLRDLQTSQGSQFLLRNYPGITPQQFVNQRLTVPPWSALVRQSWQGNVFRDAVVVQMIPIVWVLLTMAALMVFRISMRRARVRTVHMLRCVIYSGDVIVWGNLLFAAALALSAFRELRRTSGPPGETGAEAAAAAVTLLALIVFILRLRAALKWYIRMDHPTATALATQFIAFLSIIVLLINVSADFLRP